MAIEDELTPFGFIYRKIRMGYDQETFTQDGDRWVVVDSTRW